LAERAGDSESAGLAALTIMEELGELQPVAEMQALYERADELLSNSQNAETLGRLRACARRVLADGTTRIKEFSAPSFIYADERTGQLLRQARLVAGTDEPVLITGETGTGKEVLARLIHEWSGRAGQFVSINCAALTEVLIESHLFGHRLGSFEGACSEQAGAVREAAGGTLLLDNIAELSRNNQGKLLRLLEHGEIHAIGAGLPERVDVRVLATASGDLREHVRRGLIREDLFYRLNTFHLSLRPLRERPEDIPALAAHFIKELSGRTGKHVTFEADAVEAMRSLALKGNARELRSLIERAVLEAVEGTVITKSAVETAAIRRSGASSLINPWQGCSLREEVLSFEGSMVRRALETAGGSVTHASRLLGITHQRLCAMLQSRHKNLLLAKKATRPRKRTVHSNIGQ
jgi:two-component system, response regulator FlrC